MTRRIISLFFVCIIAVPVSAQRLNRSEKAIVASLQRHISYLADDKLEGRRAGTSGEKLAMEYISAQFQQAGLSPKGEQGWFQQFEINEGKQVNPATHFIVNNQDLKLHSEYFPLAFSPNTSTKAMVEMALSESGVPWFVDLADLIEKNKENPHFDLQQELINRANSASDRGATALIVHNSTNEQDGLSFNSRDRADSTRIPVIYVTNTAFNQYFKDREASYDLQIKTDIGKKSRSGTNVIGYLDKGAANTIVIGAHYDHLGYGEDSNSRHTDTSDRLVHNGADDNASGTAALFELAKLLKKSKSKSYNFLFIAFSAEELGLFGSKHFTEHPTVDLARVSYMINLDMVGRLDPATKTLTVGGIGTSPAWSGVLATAKPKNLTLKFDSSGMGPSDHASFYMKDIPVLFFFTGLHTDYHRPSDDADKINYTGALQIVQFVNQLVNASAGKGKLAFTKTRDQIMGTSARWTVSLGIMPDYAFNGMGVRVDGVLDERPAKLAGIQKGDVILALGDFNTSSLENYMQALSKFRKGDKAKVKAKRGTGMLELDVVF